MAKKFRRHFRIYFRNNHPAYIVDEEGNNYFFHKVTHSKTSGGKKNWEVEKNPIIGHDETMYIVKKQLSDKKGKFSLFKISTKPYVDISYPEIKKVGRTQNHLNDGRATISSDENIKSKRDKKCKK